GWGGLGGARRRECLAAWGGGGLCRRLGDAQRPPPPCRQGGFVHESLAAPATIGDPPRPFNRLMPPARRSAAPAHAGRRPSGRAARHRPFGAAAPATCRETRRR